MASCVLLPTEPNQAHDVITILEHCLCSMLPQNRTLVELRRAQIVEDGLHARLDVQVAGPAKEYIHHTALTKRMRGHVGSAGTDKRVARSGEARAHAGRRGGRGGRRHRARKR